MGPHPNPASNTSQVVNTVPIPAISLLGGGVPGPFRPGRPLSLPASLSLLEVSLLDLSIGPYPTSPGQAFLGKAEVRRPRGRGR